MRRVIVYVEGTSDKLAMEALLKSLIDEKCQEGIVIDFFPASSGDRKTYLLTTVPQRATNIISHMDDSRRRPKSQQSSKESSRESLLCSWQEIYRYHSCPFDTGEK